MTKAPQDTVHLAKTDKQRSNKDDLSYMKKADTLYKSLERVLIRVVKTIRKVKLASVVGAVIQANGRLESVDVGKVTQL